MAEKYNNPVGRELVRLSNATFERGYKISYDIAEENLPPAIARDVERQLRISTDKLKRENAANLNEATTKLITSTTGTLLDVATGNKNFDEAGRALAKQSTGVVKTIVIERGKQVALQEAQRLGKHFAGQASQKIIRQVGAKNPVLNAIAFGDIVKDLALDWADGKISDEQFVKLVTRRCTVLVLQSLAMNLPGGIFAGVAIEHACNELFALMDAAERQVAADRRRIVAKIKSDALSEMNRQRGLMEKYFAEEKSVWEGNVRAGFALMSAGANSNDAEQIAQGLDKILQNFGGQVAFARYDDFDDFFMDDNAVLKL